jgi:serine/threonine-protein kinase
MKELTTQIPKTATDMPTEKIQATPAQPETTAQVARRKKISKRVRRNRYIALCLAIAVGVSGWYLLIGPGSRVVVPSTVGATESEVKAALSPLGLTYTITERRYSEEIESDHVIESIPTGGGKVDQGGNVKLILSKGPERYLIPTLNGLSAAAASDQIKKLPLILGPVTEIFNATIPKGYVISSSPSAGAKVKRNSTVSLTVSKGIEQVALPSYIGKSGEQALNELTDAGFVVTTTYAFSEVKLAGEVIAQSPAGGGSANKGGAVAITISKGSEFTYIPNLLSVDEAKAVKALQDLGLKVTVKKIGKKTVKKVISMAPKNGSKVKRGSSVTITVG